MMHRSRKRRWLAWIGPSMLVLFALVWAVNGWFWVGYSWDMPFHRGYVEISEGRVSIGDRSREQTPLRGALESGFRGHRYPGVAWTRPQWKFLFRWERFSVGWTTSWTL